MVTEKLAGGFGEVQADAAVMRRYFSKAMRSPLPKKAEYVEGLAQPIKDALKS